MSEPPPLRGTRLSEDLQGLLAEVTSGGTLTLREVEARLRGRGFALFIILFAAPFLMPIPGLSTPFGLAICLMGVRLLFGRKPWLPGFVLDRELAPATMEKILRMLRKVALWMERAVRPRLHFLRVAPGMLNLIGLGLVSGGLFLLLPLPLPFTNTLPALSIILLAAGMMERDGLALLLGYGVGIVAWAYLALWVFLGKTGAEWMRTIW